MKSIFKKRHIISILLVVIFLGIMLFSLSKIKLDSSIQRLVPHDEVMERALGLTALSPVSDKVVLYISVGDPNDLEKSINEIDKIINNTYFIPQKIKVSYFTKNVLNLLDDNDKNKILKLYQKDDNHYMRNKKLTKDEFSFLNEVFKKLNFTLKDGIPNANDIDEIMRYSQQNSLLLYPSEWDENHFTKESMENGIKKKEEYLLSTPFFSPSEEFFVDPFLDGFAVLKFANSGTTGKYFPEYGGIVSQDRKSYIKVLKANFLAEDYENSKKLFDLDKSILNYAKNSGITAFFYCAHLYYWDSYKTIQLEVTLIFILSIGLTLLVFFYFFRRLSVLFYGFLPILGGFSLTFLVIAIFKRDYGGIAFAFGSTTAGISIDYTVHYLTKLCLYPNLKNLREKLTFSLSLGFLTTISAFFLLFLSNIVSLKEMAFFGIFAIAFSFLLNYFVLQKMIPPEEYQCRLYPIRIPKFGKVGFFIWLVIVVVIIFGVIFSRFEDSIINLDKKHPFMDKRIKLIQSYFKESTDSVFLVFTGDNRDQILKKSLDGLNVANKNGISFLTPAIFLPPTEVIDKRKEIVKEKFNTTLFNKALKESLFEEGSFDIWLQNISNIDSLNLSTPPNYVDEEADSMFVTWRDREYLLIQINSREKAQKLNTILKNENIDFFIVDTLKDSAKSLVEFEKRSIKLILISLIIIFVILIFAYRNLFYAFFSLLPPLVGILSTFAVATYTMRGFNIMHLSASVIILGVGVDYGIYVVGIFRKPHSDEERQNIFQSLLICALTTLAGFAVLSLSSNQAVFSLGSTMFFGVVISLLTSYFALPFLIELLNKKKITK